MDKDTMMRQNPLVSRDMKVMEEALVMLREVQAMGIEPEGYRLATADTPRRFLSSPSPEFRLKIS